ncbi:MAG: hypothetical protein K2N34_05305 [Lachnospiraceae bacterium]|nr:hypothetical protein [Lachnospiraceae bacterium]
MKYEVMVLPFKFNRFDELSKKQADNFFKWYVGQISHRIDVLKKYVDKEGKEITFDFSPESLIPLWEWFEQKIVVEKKTEEELKNEYKRYPDWMYDEISKTKVSMETLDIGMDIAIYFAEVIRKQYPEKIYWGYFTRPKNQMYVNQPVLLGFRADIPLCPSQVIKVCTLKSSEESKKTRLYDVYKKRVQLIGYVHGKRNIFRSYDILLLDVRNTGTLSLTQRKQLWASFEETCFPDDIQVREKEIRLALRTLAKAASVWDDRNVYLSKIKSVIDSSAAHFDNIDEVRKNVTEMRDLCDNALKREVNFYITQVQKALDTLEQLIECGEYFSDEDTAYYACLIWTYQNLNVPDEKEQRTERSFWEWYVWEAASIQGVTRDDIKGEEHLNYSRLETIEDFVQCISYEFAYQKCEKDEGKKEVNVYVYEQKGGGHCPICGHFSDRVCIELSHILVLAKIKGWKPIFHIKKNEYFCDNPKCIKEAFFSEQKIDDKTRKENYKNIRSTHGNEKKICKLLGIL